MRPLICDWAERLSQGLNRRIRLPSGLTFAGQDGVLTIRLGNVALSGNMQADAAAFEAWALACMAHAGARHVRLELPQALPATGGERHWWRLRYRLDRFCGLFPDRVSLHGADDVGWPPRGVGRMLLNQPLSDRKPSRDHATLMTTARASLHRESDLELALEVSPVLRARFGLQKLMRQWPVGLFAGDVAEKNHLFTGGKSAIDLIGVRDRTLVLIELKKDSNAKAGILSELLFYASLMRDALGPQPRFEFERGRQPLHCEIGPDDVRHCERVEAVLLAPRFHPIVTSQVLALLNAALEVHWIDRPVSFEAVHFDVGDSDFRLLSPALGPQP